MKKFLLFLIVACSLLSFGQKHSFAQTKKETRFIVELRLPNETIPDLSQRYEIPAGFDFEKSLIGGGYATVDCMNCPLTSEYQFWIFKAEKLPDGKVELGVIAEFKNKPACDTQKEIRVDPLKKETIDLKCGVKLVTYTAGKREENGKWKMENK